MQALRGLWEVSWALGYFVIKLWCRCNELVIKKGSWGTVAESEPGLLVSPEAAKGHQETKDFPLNIAHIQILYDVELGVQ